MSVVVGPSIVAVCRMLGALAALRELRHAREGSLGFHGFFSSLDKYSYPSLNLSNKEREVVLAVVICKSLHGRICAGFSTF